MPGIYLHIPFCRKACHYCNFHFSTSMGLKEAFVDALCREITMRSDYLESNKISSIYFGGGTPSVLNQTEIRQILDGLSRHFEMLPGAEITFEANPDDLSRDYIQMLIDTGVNRLSIGVQSFYDEDLRWMNRIHDSKQAHKVIEDCFSLGMSNFSIDLIFGSPSTSDKIWQSNLAIAVDYGIPHLSCYALTVEKGTALHHFIKHDKTPPPDDREQSRQFAVADEFLGLNDYEHYEISNYALPGKRARHNTSYWKQEAYLGLGPSAHSFDGESRQWNVSNNKKYIDAILAGKVESSREVLSHKDKFNEYLMTGLRTKWGCQWEELRRIDNELTDQLTAYLKNYEMRDRLDVDDEKITIQPRSWILADRIIGDLFMV